MDPSKVGPFFTENLGQMGEGGGLYYSHGESLSVSLAPGGASFVLWEDDGSAEGGGVMFRMHFLDSNPVEPVGILPLGHSENFFLGDDPDQWYNGVGCYREVVYEGLWQDIDLRFYFHGGLLKYDYIIHPGGEVESIRVWYDGVESLSVDVSTGDLVIGTAVRTIRDLAPRSYQTEGRSQHIVPSQFITTGERSVGFGVGDHDGETTLVIDPGLCYGTYLSSGMGLGIQVDGTGNAYVTGITSSRDFPTTTGVFDRTHNGGEDGFVAKISPDGSTLIYSTYIGGDYTDIPRSLSIDGAGNACIVGHTQSADFPVTMNAFDLSYNGDYDGFVMRLNSQGSDILYSTYLGGDGLDWIVDHEPIGDETVAVCGMTNSTDFPTTAGAFSRDREGLRDLFVARLDISSSSLDFSTLVGGSDMETCGGLDVDAQGHVFVVGSSKSDDFPVTGGAFDESFGGKVDVVHFKLETDGSSLVYSTYIGGGHYEYGKYIELDGLGRPYISGRAAGWFPTTAGSFDPTHNYGSDGYILLMNASGSDLDASSYIGGAVGIAAYDDVRGMTVDEDGSVYLTGETQCTDFPTTSDGLYLSNRGSIDTFVVKMNANLSQLAYSTYYGGSGNDLGDCVAVDGDGCIYVCGRTQSGDFPTTPGAFQTSTTESISVFAFKLDIHPPYIISDNSPPIATTGDVFMVSANVSDNTRVSNVSVESWFGDDGDHVFREPILASGTVRIGIWETSILVPSNRTEGLHYSITVVDHSGHVTTYPVSDIEVVDNDPPTFEPDQALEADTGEPFTFGVNVSDNIEVERVFVIYWFGVETREALNVSMDSDGTPVDPTRGRFWLVVDIPLYSLAPLHYSYTAVDPRGNWNTTETGTVLVRDIQLPVLLDDLSDEEATTGDVFTFKVRVADNIGVKSIIVNHNVGGRPFQEGQMLVVDISGWGNGTYDLPVRIPDDWIGQFQYSFSVFDTSGNVFETVESDLTVTDDDPPQLIVPVIQPDDHPVKGLTFGLEVGVEDNLVTFRDAWDAHLEYWFADGTHHNVTMSYLNEIFWPPLRYRSYVEVPREAVGSIYYIFSAVDSAGNWNSTELLTLPLVNTPPTIEDIPLWEVVEGVEEFLDLSQYILDLNDEKSNLVLSCSDGNVTVTSHRLRLCYYDWLAPHFIEISVSDGEDVVFANITVNVTNVNDPPRILGIEPSDGTSFKEGQEIAFRVNASDDDGDDLEFTWMEGETVLGSGIEFFYSMLGPGDHMITLVVDDGMDSTIEDITLNIKKKQENGPGYAVVVTIAAMLLVAGSASRRRSRRQRVSRYGK